VVVELPLFPLGSVLLPHMPLPLRIFEDRYLIMLSRILQEEPSQFGQVLIERGQESGGGEARFPIGTVATITELQGDEGSIGLLARGAKRFDVVEWLADDPYPRAMVSFLDDLEWDAELEPLLERADETVRRVLSVASEYSDQTWPADIALSDDPVELAWQLAGIAPLGPLDHVGLLRASSVRQLLDETIEHTLVAEQMLAASWPDSLEGMDE
jgi:Lon protease-like protein